MEQPTDRMTRLLILQKRLLQGQLVQKRECAEEFGVTEKSVQRDIESLRTFFAEQTERTEICYEPVNHGYRLGVPPVATLTPSEVLAVCKILLESRSMIREEIFPILDKLIQSCTPEDKLKQVQTLIQNERYHYVEPHHGQAFISCLWKLGTAVRDQRVTEITYIKLDKTSVQRTIEPVGILFSEYYFYLAAFIEGVDRSVYYPNMREQSPTIYRIDRIVDFRVTDQHFPVVYQERFEEGEMRKRIQFMYGGKLRTVRFVYTGPNLEAVLDRLPTAKVIATDPETGCPTVEAEVFGNGIEMWLRSQGEYVSVVNP